MKEKIIYTIIVLIIAILLGLLSGYAISKYQDFKSPEQSTIQLDATAPTLEPLR